MKRNYFVSKEKITKVAVTSDTLASRGGLVLFVRYLSSIKIYGFLDASFGGMRKSCKGVAIWEIFKQIFCNFYDGTSRHLVHFDHIKKDAGYAGSIESISKDMLSSHQVKRFFKGFSWFSGGIFRKILKRLFIWRLKIKAPKVIKLTIDTMVMDNNEAKKRHGAQPTYKKVLGFQPLQMIWDGKIIDAIFRGGKKHSNSGNTVINMVTDLVRLIRKEYDPHAAIILRLDSGFFDEANFKAFEALGIGFICTGKVVKKIKSHIQALEKEQWAIYDNGRQVWEYIECGLRYGTWSRFIRAFYTKPYYEEEQRLLDFARPDNIILTNIGMNPAILKHLSPEEQAEIEQGDWIIKNHHQRGADELPHRGLKDFGFEELPFKRFSANSAYYYCMLISFFIFETYKEDVLSEVIPVVSYATRVRRQALDFAAKIVKTGGEIILKVTQAVMDRLDLAALWRKSQKAQPIIV